MYENKYTIIIQKNSEDLYKIMKDLNNYPQIIPYIKSITHLNTGVPIKAHIILEHWMIKLEYDCDIYFHDDNHSIIVNGYGYSFEKIEGIWKLKKLSDNVTEISYELRFKMKSKIQQKIAEKIFALYGDKMRDKLMKYCLLLSDHPNKKNIF